MCGVASGSGREGSGASLQLAAHETFDQAWGGRLDPEPEPGRRLSTQSLISGWQNTKPAHFLLFCWSVIRCREEKLLV